MGGTGVACIGQWWTARAPENLWLSSCVREAVRWWVHRVNSWTSSPRESTQISHGLCCLSSPRSITELTWKRSRYSPNGFYKTRPDSARHIRIKGIFFKQKCLSAGTVIGKKGREKKRRTESETRTDWEFPHVIQYGALLLLSIKINEPNSKLKEF